MTLRFRGAGVAVVGADACEYVSTRTPAVIRPCCPGQRRRSVVRLQLAPIHGGRCSRIRGVRPPRRARRMGDRDDPPTAIEKARADGLTQKLAIENRHVTRCSRCRSDRSQAAASMPSVAMG